jgi:hypothetical protein
MPPEKNISAFGLNVCPISGCPRCKDSKGEWLDKSVPVPGLGYNNCFNDRQMEYVNDLRALVKAPKVVFDAETAKSAQSWATKFETRGSGATSDATRPDDCVSLHF